MTSYRQIRPSLAVAGFVECYWLLEDCAASSRADSEIQRIVPDGRPELILNLGDPFESQQNTKWQRQPEFFFAGQITRPMLIRPAASSKVLGIRFRPFGARYLFRVPAYELA